jgi:hypothetical protein
LAGGSRVFDRPGLAFALVLADTPVVELLSIRTDGCTEIVLPLHDLLYIAKGPALLDVQPHDFWPKLLPGLRHSGKQDTGGEQQEEGRRAKEERSQDNNGFRKRRRRRIKLEAGVQILAGNYRNKDLMRNSASSEATGRQVVV